MYYQAFLLHFEKNRLFKKLTCVYNLHILLRIFSWFVYPNASTKILKTFWFYYMYLQTQTVKCAMIYLPKLLVPDISATWKYASK